MKKKYVLGIDLGTTNCCVAYFADGQTHIIEDGTKRTTESLICYDGDRKFFGEAARSRVGAADVVNLQKCCIGRSLSEFQKVGHQNKFFYTVESGSNDTLVMKLPSGLKKNPVETSADLLSYLKSNAERKLGVTISDVVITVPAHFNDEQRHATKQAGEVAGLNVLRIINEPTAAALAYGLDKVKGNKTILVYDFGGGTFDCTILQISEGVVEVLSTNGDLWLGGSDIDSKIRDVLVSDIRQNHGFDPLQNPSNAARLMEVSEALKKELASVPESGRNILLIKGAGILNYEAKLTRAQLDKIVAPFVEKTIKISKDALNAAEKKTGSTVKIDSVVMVGGSTRLLKVKEAVKESFRVEIDSTINPDEVVAYGAAIQGAILSGAAEGHDAADLLLLDVTPLSLGIETKGGVMTKLVEANSTIPIKKSQVFTTAENNQTVVSIRIAQGERSMFSDNKLLGTFDLSGIQSAPAGVPQIEVTFDIDANGMLVVSAMDKSNNKSCSINIQTKGAVSDADIQKMKEDAAKYAEEDAQRLKLITIQNECESLIHSTRESLDKNKDKIPEDFAASVHEKINQTEAAIKSRDIELMEEKKKELNELSNQIYSYVAKSGDNNNTTSEDKPADAE